MPTFVAVGEVMLDVAAAELAPGRVVHAPISVRAGGSPVTAALAAAAEGVDAAVVAGSPQLVRLDRLHRVNALFLDERELEAVGGDVAALRERFRLLCVKRGPAGATAYLDGWEETRTPPDRVDRARAGAGDAF